MEKQPNDDDKLKDYNNINNFSEHPEKLFKSFKRRKDITNRGDDSDER